jgi:hypothetical protein
MPWRFFSAASRARKLPEGIIPRDVEQIETKCRDNEQFITFRRVHFPAFPSRKRGNADPRQPCDILPGLLRAEAEFPVSAEKTERESMM